jgi:hypothetical protein
MRRPTNLVLVLFFGLFVLVSGLFAQDRVETSTDKFNRNVIKSAVKAAKDGTITRRDVMRLRVAMLSPAFREQAQQLAIVQMSASGSDALGSDAVPTDEDGKVIETAIDWDKLLSFIEKLIPILLQLLDAFGENYQPHQFQYV